MPANPFGDRRIRSRVVDKDLAIKRAGQHRKKSPSHIKWWALWGVSFMTCIALVVGVNLSSLHRSWSDVTVHRESLEQAADTIREASLRPSLSEFMRTVQHPLSHAAAGTLESLMMSPPARISPNDSVEDATRAVAPYFIICDWVADLPQRHPQLLDLSRNCHDLTEHAMGMMKTNKQYIGERSHMVRRIAGSDLAPEPLPDIAKDGVFEHREQPAE